MRFRHLVISILICSVMVSVPFAAYLNNRAAGKYTSYNVYAADETADDEGHQSSFEYKNFRSLTSYKTMLRIKMPDVYRKLAGDLDDAQTVPIPGTLATCASTDGSVMSDSYIPQGMCRAGAYWLVTAYDGGKKNPSVIYVINPAEKQLISTILLPNRYHVGGIACDGERIWLTGDTSDRYKGRPFVQYISYDYFIGLIRKKITEVSKAAISDKVFIKNKPSFLECEGGKLWVGTYIGTKETKEGYIYGYTINDSGEGDILNTTLMTVITAIDSSAQGMDIDGNHLYVSSSYKGDSPLVKSSFITKYEIRPIMYGAPYLNVENREVSRIEVPKMNEEIIIEDDYVHINFESSAKKWKYPVIRTDRILAVSKP